LNENKCEIISDNYDERLTVNGKEIVTKTETKYIGQLVGPDGEIKVII
jgi:hypothetical protein